MKPLLPAPDVSFTSPSPAAPRRRGRPPGAKTSIGAAHALRLHHFQFVRAALELPLRSAWQRYLAFAGGPDDERHFRSQLRELSGRIRQAAEQRGLARLAEVGLHGHAALLEARTGTAPAAAVPSLDDWIAERCEQLGVDADFQSQAEWFAEYAKEFGLDRSGMPRAATALPVPAAQVEGGGPGLREQLRALHQLATEIARPPALDDALAGWLAQPLCRALQTRGVLTLGNLIDFVNLNQHRWYERVAGIGRERARRLGEWLAPLAGQLGRPLRPQVLHSRTSLALARRAALAGLEPASTRRFGLVPLERLAVPPELSGRQGVFRLQQPNVFGAEDDLGAIRSWLQRHAMSPRTFEAYGREVERFYLWCLRVARKPLSSLVEADLHAYRAFLAQPPADWV